MGYASALAWILLLIILLTTGVMLRLSRGRVYYEGER
jgi:multiple sugar transport system permease protein